MAAKAVVVGLGDLGLFTSRSQHCRKFVREAKRLLHSHTPSASSHHKGPNFGLFFDIDGVIVRGGSILPNAREAFNLLTNEAGEFWVPSIFVTNAGNVLRRSKAEQLSRWLDVQVKSSQVVMSHSPLRRFHQFLDKHVLVAGQGPTKEIARYLGFKKVTTIETLRQCFPMLDMVDHARRKTAPCSFEKYFPRIEAVILFGEPVRWETNLQLIIDVLLTNGQPSEQVTEIPYPHLPILGCNMDLMWMSEAPMPRFGHGCFMHCLESLYQKISGYELKYTALVGKPSEITYHHSEQVLKEQSEDMNLPVLRKMYCIGDNPDVDIYGANLFNKYLMKRREKHLEKQKPKRVQQGAVASAKDRNPMDHEMDHSDIDICCSTSEDYVDLDFHSEDDYPGMTKCESVLVCTGVYSQNRDLHGNHSNTTKKQMLLLNHNHRDFIMDPELRKPKIFVADVLEAVKTIFRHEGIS